MFEKKTVQVAVHKANINLMKDESLAEFSNDLSRRIREHVKKSLSEKDYMWMVEIFPNKAVYKVCKGGGEGRQQYWSIEWKRDKNKFTFGTKKEVVRRVKFEEQDGIAIATKADESWVEKSLWGNIL